MHLHYALDAEMGNLKELNNAKFCNILIINKKFDVASEMREEKKKKEK